MKIKLSQLKRMIVQEVKRSTGDEISAKDRVDDALSSLDAAISALSAAANNLDFVAGDEGDMIKEAIYSLEQCYEEVSRVSSSLSRK